MRFPLIFAIGLLFASLPYRSTAQTPCPTAGIETNPPRATNPLPGGIVNRFNWYYGDYQPATYSGRRYTLNAPSIGQPYLELPWQQPNNVNMERFQGQNDISTNGWQLIRRDLGYDDNGNPANTTNPTVIIYNRYLGVLRVFVAVGQLYNSYQRAEVKLVFDGAGAYKAGTLNRQTALGVALEDTPAGQTSEFAAVARFLNGSGKWFTADFPMDYDPCVCLFDSRFRVEVNLITSMNVALQGTTTGTITTANGSSTGDFSNGIPLIRKINGAINGAGTSYDNVDKLTNKLIGSGADKTAVGLFQTAIKDNKFLQQGLAALPYVGTAIGLLDFFTGGGQDSSPQPLALQPLAIEMSTTTTGTISATSLYVTVPFNNPGNRLATTIPEDKPYYDEALGVFSLLKRPVVERTVKTSPVGDGSLIRKVSFRLPNDLQYVINPAAGLKVQDFQVALIAENVTNAGVNPGGSFYNYEGAIPQPNNGSTDLYRTNYLDAACIKNSHPFLNEPIKTGDASSEYRNTAVYIKIMLNLRPISASSTQQNVLFVARYPVTLTTVTSFAPLLLAECGVLDQASAGTVQALCNSTTYHNAVALRGTRPVAKSGVGVIKSTQSITVYPNPATASVRFNFKTALPGHVRIFLSDALGREVKQILETDSAGGEFETAASIMDLQPGIYYCTLQTPDGRIGQKLVVTK